MPAGCRQAERSRRITHYNGATMSIAPTPSSEESISLASSRSLPREAPIRVVFFDEAIGFGGSVVVLSHLLRYLDRSRYVPLVVTSLDPAATRTLFDPADLLHQYRPHLQYATRLKWMSRCPGKGTFLRKLWAYAFSCASAVANLVPMIRMLRKVRRARPSIIHVNNGAEGLLAARLLRVPFVWHLHGVPTELVRGTYNAKQAAAAFISISQYIASEVIRHGADPARIHLVPNPTPGTLPGPHVKAAWRARLHLPENAVVIAHVGRLVRWKGQKEFLQAFSRIASRHPNAIALIVGDDVEGHASEYPMELRQYVREHELEHRVLFTGHVDSIMEIMTLSDVVVHSSIEPEPFGLVIIEAMIAGAAVIAARLGAPVEIIEHEITGLLVDPRDTAEFAAALEQLLAGDEKRRRLAYAGQRAASERYSPETFARSVGAVYEQIETRAHEAGGK